MPTAAKNKQPQDPLRQLSSITKREILLKLLMSEKTLMRVLRGGIVRPASRERVRRELEARGLLHLLPEVTADAR